MAAAELLADLIGAGFEVSGDGDRLMIRPASRLTDEQRAAIRRDKLALLGLLTVTPIVDAGVAAGAGGESRPSAATAATAVLPAAPPAAADPVAGMLAAIQIRTARRDRLICCGWPEAEADEVLDWLARGGGRGGSDDRRCCVFDCAHYRPGRCGNWRRAGLGSPGPGRDLAVMPQRCPGFREAEREPVRTTSRGEANDAPRADSGPWCGMDEGGDR